MSAADPEPPNRVRIARPVCRVAVIGAGPAGAIAIDALARERAFDVIRVFERNDKAGGCWVYGGDDPVYPTPSLFDSLARGQTADPPVPIPPHLPLYTSELASIRQTLSTIALPVLKQRSDMVFRHDSTPSYSYLETNVDARVMEYTQEPIVFPPSSASVDLHGEDTPFLVGSDVREWIEGLVYRRGYEKLVEWKTTVESVQKIKKNNSEEGSVWEVVLRKEAGDGDGQSDLWWKEEFDAVVVASGHYSVPYIPPIPGLAEFAERYPGSIVHSKYFRVPERYKNKRVVVLGASVSSADILTDLLYTAQKPLHAITRDKYNIYFGPEAFRHPFIHEHAHTTITSIDPLSRTIHLANGDKIGGVDVLFLGTGYTWTVPFLSEEIREEVGGPKGGGGKRVPGLYQHVFWRKDPTLAFVGAVGTGLTFKVFEYQSVALARFLARRASLPPIEERERWEAERIEKKGCGTAFTVLLPDFEQYFEELRALAGPHGPGRQLPPFDRQWVKLFFECHERRKRAWKERNERDRFRLASDEPANEKEKGGTLDLRTLAGEQQKMVSVEHVKMSSSAPKL